MLAILLFAVVSAGNAQTAREMMNANQKTWELVNTYVETTDLTSQYPQRAATFKRLFESQATTVYMDHVGWYNNSNRKDTTTLANYCSFYEQQQGSFTQFSISDVAINYLGYDGAVMTYVSELTKQYQTRQLDKPVNIRLALHIVYNVAKREAKITRIECKRSDSRMRPHIMANYLKDDNSWYIPKTLEVKSIGGSETRLSDRVQPLSAEVYKQLSERNCATYRYEFIPHTDSMKYHTISVNTVKNAVGVSAGVVLPLGSGGFVLPDDAAYSFTSPSYSTWTFHLGVDYWRQIFAVGRHRVTFGTGISLLITPNRFSADGYGDRYDTVDMDGTPYQRITQLAHYKEVRRDVSVAVPALLRYDYYVIPSLSVFGTVGVNGALDFINRAKASFEGYYAGQYGPEYFNTLIDQNGYYDFGTFPASDRELEEQVDRTLGWHLDALARVGVQWFFTADNRWSAEFSAGYRNRFLSSSSEKVADFRLSGNAEQFTSVHRNLTTTPVHYLDVLLSVKYNF